MPSHPEIISSKVPPRSRGRDESPSVGRDQISSGAGLTGNGNGPSSMIGGGGNNPGRRLFALGGVGGEAGGTGGGGGGAGGTNSGFDNSSLKRGFQQGGGQGYSVNSSGDRCGVGSSPPIASARYPPLEHIQNPPQPDPKVRVSYRRRPLR